MSNPQAVSEAKEAIIKHIDNECANLEKDEYKEVLAELIDDLEFRKNAVEEELEYEAGGEEEEEE